MFDKDELFDEDFGFTTFSEVKGICTRHIEEGGTPYNEDEFMYIMNWIQEVKMNESLLSLVLMGDLDIVFGNNDDEKLLFKLTKSGQKKADDLISMGGDPPRWGKNINFGDDNQKEN